MNFYDVEKNKEIYSSLFIAYYKGKWRVETKEENSDFKHKYYAVILSNGLNSLPYEDAEWILEENEIPFASNRGYYERNKFINQGLTILKCSDYIDATFDFKKFGTTLGAKDLDYVNSYIYSVRHKVGKLGEEASAWLKEEGIDSRGFEEE